MRVKVGVLFGLFRKNLFRVVGNTKFINIKNKGVLKDLSNV